MTIPRPYDHAGDDHPYANNTGSSNQDELFDNLLNHKFDGTNFVDWYRSLSIFLKYKKMSYVLESPIPDKPPANAAKTTQDAWIKHKDDSFFASCCMLASIIPNLEKGLQNIGAYEMLKRVKEMCQLQNRLEHYMIVNELLGCKMAEGSSVSSHVLKMKSCIERLEILGFPLSNEFATFMIFSSLPKSYDQFIQNFITNNWEMSLSDLHVVLKIDEKEKKKSNSSKVLMVREGRVAKAKGKGKAKNDTCFKCGQVGHWLRNCPIHLKEVEETKAR